MINQSYLLLNIVAVFFFENYINKIYIYIDSKIYVRWIFNP